MTQDGRKTPQNDPTTAASMIKDATEASQGSQASQDFQDIPGPISSELSLPSSSQPLVSHAVSLTARDF